MADTLRKVRLIRTRSGVDYASGALLQLRGARLSCRIVLKFREDNYGSWAKGIQREADAQLCELSLAVRRALIKKANLTAEDVIVIFLTF